MSKPRVIINPVLCSGGGGGGGGENISHVWRVKVRDKFFDH